MLAPAVLLLPDGRGYRLYIECVFDELSREVKVLFDRRDVASALWPRRGHLPTSSTHSTLRSWLGCGRRTRRSGGCTSTSTAIPTVKQLVTMPRESPDHHRTAEILPSGTSFLLRGTLSNFSGTTPWAERGSRCGRARPRFATAHISRGPKDEPIPARPKKDPRDLRIIDPACGSGHFLLYSFDLLVSIYQEAWEDPASPVSSITGRTLRDDYPDHAALEREIPGQILRHNLHGIDIDARCAQIAALALWMRAQRAFQDSRIDRDARPPSPGRTSWSPSQCPARWKWSRSSPAR